MNYEEEDIIEVALFAGNLLLENGAEIFRVEETIERICQFYGAKSMESFVLSNGIFITAGNKEEKVFAKVKHIPVSAAHLDTVNAINQLSREIVIKDLTLEETKKRLDTIANMPHYKKWAYILASGIGSAGFCYLFGGNIYDAMVALIAGLVLYILILLIENQFSKIVQNIIGGMIVSMICITLLHFHIGEHLNFMVIGAIMPLIPGVPFINSIREIAAGDYLSGTVRMLDALVVFLCIAIGVGFGINIMNLFLGGILL